MPYYNNNNNNNNKAYPKNIENKENISKIQI